jgi:uncharacterized protein with HEPN domain
LSDIFWSIELIEQFSTSTASFQEYLLDLKTQSTIERQLSIIGEAVNKFEKLQPESTRKNTRKIVGFRNRLIHTYDAADPSMIWAILVKPVRIPVKK